MKYSTKFPMILLNRSEPKTTLYKLATQTDRKFHLLCARTGNNKIADSIGCNKIKIVIESGQFILLINTSQRDAFFLCIIPPGMGWSKCVEKKAGNNRCLHDNRRNRQKEITHHHHNPSSSSLHSDVFFSF